MITCPRQKLSELFKEFYGMSLSLNGDKIKVKATRKIYSGEVQAAFEWLRKYREHVIECLRMEGNR